jgi:hypothetical protein
MFFVGSFVSPAVMAILSVPPSATLSRCWARHYLNTLTSERCGHKNRCKATDTTDKWRITLVPELATNILVICVASGVDYNPEDDENDYGDDFEKTQPILKL